MAAVTNDFPAFEPHMKGPVTYSVLIHALFIIIAIVGLPYLKPDLPELDSSISVELVDIDELTEIMKPQDKPRDQTKPQPKEQKKDEPPKPVMPTVTSATPPKPVPPAPPEKTEKPPEKTEVTPRESDLAPPVKKTEPTTKPKAPPKPVPRPVLTKETPPEQQDQFNALLKNLMPNQEEPVKADQPRKGEQSALSQMASRMSMSEMDALKTQLSQCWSLMAGARYAEDLVVDINIVVNPDRSVKSAKIENALRYNTDQFFRAAAESALRAVYKCSPLDLPPEKYEQWKNLIVTFDPRTML